MDSNDWPVQGLAASLNITFNDPALLRQAMVHSSYLNEHADRSLGSNERLEFLGDAVLGLVISEKLVRDDSELGEGELTRRRAALVRTETLASVASDLGLDRWLLLGKGESASGGQSRQRLIGSAFEAVIGAIYLDQGLDSASEFVVDALARYLNSNPDELGVKDPKSQLQERVQRIDGSTPTYEVITTTGPDHAPSYTVTVRFDDQAMEMGKGTTKRKAEQEAARMALERLDGESEN